MAKVWNKADEDYRTYKQPIHLRNPMELKTLTELEKEQFLDKLTTEIHEYKNREAVYAAKRKELLEIENAYRAVQQKQQNKTSLHKDKTGTQQEVAVFLDDQVEDFRRKHEQQKIAIADVNDKIQNIDDVIRRRDEECSELRRVIEQKNDYGRKMQERNESMKYQQQDLLNEFEQQKEKLFQARDYKETVEADFEDLLSKIKQKKDHFYTLETKNNSLGNQVNQKLKDLSEIERQISLLDQDIQRKTHDLQDLQREKDNLEIQITDMAGTIQECSKEKMVVEDYIADILTNNKLIKQQIERLREIIEEFMYSTEQINNCNDIKREENQQLSLEVEATNKHIILLQDQNKELEKELDRFLQCDNEIRNKLIDRNRSPLRLNDLYCGYDSKQKIQKHEFTIIEEKQITSTPNLLDLKMCPQTSSAMNSVRQRQYSPLRQYQSFRENLDQPQIVQNRKVQFQDEWEQNNQKRKYEPQNRQMFASLRDRSNSQEKQYKQLIPQFQSNTYSSKTLRNDQDSRPELQKHYDDAQNTNSAWKSKYARTFEKKVLPPNMFQAPGSYLKNSLCNVKQYSPLRDRSRSGSRSLSKGKYPIPQEVHYTDYERTQRKNQSDSFRY